MDRIIVIACCALGIVVGANPAGRAQEPSAPAPIAAADLLAAIDRLGSLDYAIRTGASRTVRRTPASQAVPALVRAVDEHKDGYVRYRALVLLTGFNDPRTRDIMRESLSSPNDRLRTVAYSFFEHHPDGSMLPTLLAALDREEAEFVRPALVRALAAAAASGSGADVARARQALTRDVSRGEDFFRGAVIEALGDYRARYAVGPIVAVAKLDGPLQDDAVIALGKIGDKSTLETMAGLQRTAPRDRQPAVAAAICLLGVNCASHEGFAIDTLTFTDTNPGYQELLRSAAFGLGAIGVSGRASAVSALFDIGIPSRDPTRAPIALALATIALRNTPAMMTTLPAHPDRDGALSLLAEGFDMLEEDLLKERFFAFARRTYWESADGSATRAMMQMLIGKLDF